VWNLKRLAEGLASGMDERLRIHDFRIVPGDTHTNLIFDLSVPFEMKETDAALRSALADAIHGADDRLFAVITVDRE
jgi:thiamine monophosphate kinase